MSSTQPKEVRVQVESHAEDSHAVGESPVEPVEQSQAETQVDNVLVVEKTVQPNPVGDAPVVEKQIVSMDSEEQKIVVPEPINRSAWRFEAAQVHTVCISTLLQRLY